MRIRRLFLEFINSFLHYIFTEFIILLCNFLVISFVRYKEFMVCLISFSKLSEVLPALTCANAIGNLISQSFYLCFSRKNSTSESIMNYFLTFKKIICIFFIFTFCFLWSSSIIKIL